jgi:protein-S-isoprenylcysteine O-methyltransferase Ste14
MPSALVFTSEPQGLIFYVVYFAWLLGELVGATILPRVLYGARDGTRRDRGSLFFNVITLVFAISVDFALSLRGIALISPIAYYVGVILIVAGLVLRQWAIAILGRYFTLTVKIQSEHTIVEQGPYKLIRHPSYSGLLLTLIGVGLALQTWAGVALNVLVFAIVFGYRIYVEEKALNSALGERYASYSRRTKRLIPYII